MSTFQKTVAVLVMVLAAGAVGYAYFIDSDEQVFCTMEAKQCPDGSYVGRSGPKCEFAACPADPYQGWDAAQDENGVIIRYPESLPTSYIRAVDWPPQVQLLNEPFACTEAGSPIARAGRTERRTVDGREYCVTEVREGAAGSVYSQYAYAFPKDGQTAVLTFSLRTPQCGNYDETEKQACETELGSFDLNVILDRIARSLRD